MSMLLSILKDQMAFILVTVLMGGAAAYATGKAIAQTWRPYWHVPVYMLGMAAVTRFCHFALFEERLLDIPGYLIEFAVLLIASAAGYRLMRAHQMASQYGWLYEAAGHLGWRKRS